MKKILLKIAIGIVAVPTVALGALYVTRNIPIVNEKIVTPLAQASESIGLPVIVKPKISDEMIREHISILKEKYYVQKHDFSGSNYPNHQTDSINQWLEKIGCFTKEGNEPYKNVKTVNTQPGFGTEYVCLLYSDSEGYNLTWREFLEMYLNVIDSKMISKADIERALELDLQEDIPIYDSTNASTNSYYQETNKEAEDAFDKAKEQEELEQQRMEELLNEYNQ